MPRDSENGSILVEAIVAVTILSVTLALALSALAGYFRSTGTVQQTEIAVSRLTSKMEELSVDPSLAEGESSGPLAKGLTWRMSATRVTPDTTSPAEAYHVTLEAQTIHGKHVTKIETFLLKPRRQ